MNAGGVTKFSPASRAALLAISLLLALPAAAKEPASADVAYFESQVRPLLAAHCFKCHGAKKEEASLRLDSRAAMLRGGENGPALVAGSPAESLLIRAVKHEGDVKMPPDDKLKTEEIAALVRWVELGARVVAW